jgi:hypothetical protein
MIIQPRPVHNAARTPNLHFSALRFASCGANHNAGPGSETVEMLGNIAIVVVFVLLLMAGLVSAQEQQALPLDNKDFATAGANRVKILLDGKNFAPFPVFSADGVNPTWRGCKPADVMSRLTRTKPAAITKEPKYKGGQQMYGYVNLGTRKNNKFYFVVDVVSKNDMAMYFDANQDGDFTDDGPALKNVGRFKTDAAGYAAVVKIPWKQLGVSAPFQDDYQMWFILNAFQYSVLGFSHYSLVQIKGKINIGGQDYTAVLADRAQTDNNADFAHDGIYLRKAGAKREDVRYISAEEAKKGADIGGKKYIFDIRYPAH